MQTSGTFYNRLGALILGVSTLLFFAGPLYAPVDAAQGANSLLWQTGWLFILGMALFPLGMLAVYVYLAKQRGGRLALFALIFQLMALGPLQAFAGADTLAFAPMRKLYFQEGNEEIFLLMGKIMTSFGGGPGFYSLLGLGFVLLDVGMILLAISIWRAGSLSKWAAVIYTVGYVLFIVAAFTPVGHIARISDALLGGVGGIWLAWSLWQQKPANTGL